MIVQEIKVHTKQAKYNHLVYSHSTHYVVTLHNHNIQSQYKVTVYRSFSLHSHSIKSQYTVTVYRSFSFAPELLTVLTN